MNMNMNIPRPRTGISEYLVTRGVMCTWDDECPNADRSRWRPLSSAWL